METALKVAGLSYLVEDIEYVLADLEHAQRLRVSALQRMQSQGFHLLSPSHKSLHKGRARRRARHLQELRRAWMEFHYSNRKVRAEKLLQSALYFYINYQAPKMETRRYETERTRAVGNLYAVSLSILGENYITNMPALDVLVVNPVPHAEVFSKNDGRSVLYTLVLLGIWNRWTSQIMTEEAKSGHKSSACDDLHEILFDNDPPHKVQESPETRAKAHQLCKLLGYILSVTPHSREKAPLKYFINLISNHM